MSSTNEFEKLYNERVERDEALEKNYKGLIEYVVDTVISRMKAQSPEFKAIYSEALYAESLTSRRALLGEEFYLNIVLCSRDDSYGTYLDLVDDPTGKSFCHLKDCGASRSQVLAVGNKEKGDTFISPNKIFELMQRSVDQVLTNKGLELMYEGRTYQVTQVPPATTLLIAVVNGSKSCKVNLVPTFKLNWSMFCRDLQQKVNDSCQQFRSDLHPRRENWDQALYYMATALPGADKLMFDLSKFEGWLVPDDPKSNFKKVIKLMEHLRNGDSWLSSKLLKVG